MSDLFSRACVAMRREAQDCAWFLPAKRNTRERLAGGAAGRVGSAVLELGGLAGLRLFGTASAGDRAAVERLGGVAIDYRSEDFLARVRELTGDGVDVVLDGLGGAVSLRSF